MTIFDYVTATILIVLGLGITELLNHAIGLFRERRRFRPDWIALAWAGIIFAFQMQFVWGIFEIQALVSAWTAFMFMVALVLALLLFAAGALIIPRPTADGTWDPWERFLENGRWSLLALACYSFIAFLSNPLYFEIELLAPVNLLNLGLCAFLAGTFMLKDRKLWIWATLVVAIYSAYEIVLLSPATYS